jgi:small-conductance mechanosensitive channel
MSIVEQFKNGELVRPDTFLGALIYALAFGAVAWLVGRALRRAVQRILARDTHAYMDRTAVNFLSQLVQIGVYLFAFISYAHVVPALSGLGTAWLASVSVISVIMGLAAQNTLGNLIAGISLLLYRPFNAGDRLQVNAPTGLETGVVESLNLGYTVLKTDDNRRVVVPNSVMASQTTVNLTSEDPRVLCTVPITITYATDLDQARALLLEVARQQPGAKEVCGCPVTQLSPAGVVLSLSAWCANVAAAGDFKCAVLEQARKRFAAAGIEAPLPQTTVTLRTVAAAPGGPPPQAG